MYTRHDPTSSLNLPPTVRIDGSKIKEIRERQGLTQLYVATAVGVTTDTISRWENRRYPSIKRENALKLAEALEVEIEEILEPETESREAQESGTKREKGRTDWFKPSRIFSLMQNNPRALLGMAVFLFAAGIFILWVHGRSAGNIVVSANRILPSHCAPGTTFPVLIEVGVTPKGPLSLLVKEELPEGVRPIKGDPPFSKGQTSGMLKWIFQGDAEKKVFCYAAKMDTKTPLGSKLTFKGSVTIRKGATLAFSIDGDEIIEAAPFHWADLNQDNIIDDEEILAVYDTFSGLNAVESELKDLENIWSAGAYKWDATHGKFVTMESRQGVQK